MEITHLKHNQINKKKWDAAIKDSQNGLIYALSWFLDIVSPNWEALVESDYNIVMPLTIKEHNKKRIFYKPVFLQFLGVFGNHLDQIIIEKFIRLTKKKVDGINVWFNPQNILNPGEHYIKRESQVLSLNKSYNDIFAEYNRSNKQNLKKALSFNLSVSKRANIKLLVDTFKNMYSKKSVEEVNDVDYNNLERIVRWSLNNTKGEFYSNYFDGEICSIAYFIFWKDIFTIYCATSHLGREKRSFFLLIDQFLKDHAGQNAVLDFAGSNISGVAYINKGFGGVSNSYYAVNI